MSTITPQSFTQGTRVYLTQTGEEGTVERDVPQGHLVPVRWDERGSHTDHPCDREVTLAAPHLLAVRDADAGHRWDVRHGHPEMTQERVEGRANYVARWSGQARTALDIQAWLERDPFETTEWSRRDQMPNEG